MLHEVDRRAAESAAGQARAEAGRMLSGERDERVQFTVLFFRKSRELSWLWNMYWPNCWWSPALNALAPATTRAISTSHVFGAFIFALRQL